MGQTVKALGNENSMGSMGCDTNTGQISKKAEKPKKKSKKRIVH